MFLFIPEGRPFPRWHGPFSPGHGTYSGFRINRGRCGTWVESAGGSNFWELEHSEGADALSSLMTREWGGGRVLLLPNGYVVKPLQTDEERSPKVLIGRFEGAVVLKDPDGNRFDLSRPGSLQPGDRWPGPKSTGLECSIQANGSLTCNWYRNTASGMTGFMTEQLRGPDEDLAQGFRVSRPGELGGRIRITANGAIITNRRLSDSAWNALYVGSVDTDSWPDWEKWVERISHGHSAADRHATGDRHRR